MYDCIIIGGGPAGISAAINLKLLGKNFIWFSSSSEKVTRAERVGNYVGLPDVTGRELNAAFDAHIKSLGLERTREVVTGVYETGDFFTALARNESYEGKSVILCLGVQVAKPVEGESEFLGRGVSYCATCDGELYRGKDIAVLCADKSFEGEAKFLVSLARTAYIVPLYRGCEINAPNARLILKKPLSVTGDMRVRRVNFKDESVDVDGMFILRNSVAPSALLKGLNLSGGHIIVDRACATSVKGVFAAGDCTGRPYQYAKAVGEGNVAAHSVVEYLDKSS